MAGSVVGKGLTIEGEITSEDDVDVQGTLRGTLTTTGRVVVGAEALVEADVSAATLSLAGKLTGNVTSADRVDLQGGGRLVGDVRAARLTIADGASFKGNVDMDV